MDVAVAESAAGEVTVLTPELSIWVLVSIVPNVLGLSSEKLPEPTVGGSLQGRLQDRHTRSLPVRGLSNSFSESSNDHNCHQAHIPRLRSSLFTSFHSTL